MRKQDVSGSISKIIEIIGIDPDVWSKYSGKMLMSIGLDSVDVAKLRAIIQPKPSFQKLYGMRLSDIADMVVDTTASEQPNGEQKHGGSVALTPMQESYLYGDKQGTPCIVYSEFSLKNVDVNILISSIDHVILQEPMLHACIHNDTSQTIKPEHEWQGISGKKIEDIVDYGEFRRSLMDNLISSEDRHWEVCLTKGSQGLTLHVAIDMLFMDAASAVLLAKRVAKTYEDLLGGSSLNLTPTEPPIFFDYAQRFSTPVMFDKVSEEEKEKVKGFPGPPQLPRKKHDSLPTPSFSRESGALSEKHWDKIKELAQIHSVTSNAIMLAAFSETLSLFAENPDFTITVTCSDRVSLSGHQFDGAIGDFTNVILCPVSTDNQNLLELAKSINTRLIEGIEEDGIGGLDAVRLLRHLNHDPHLNFPIVFTSFLGVVETVALKGADVTLSYQQTQTPQLTLDHQVYESKGKLITNWDFDETIYSSDQISSMLGCFLRVLTKFAEGENSDAALSSSEHALRVEMNQTTEDFEPASPHLLHEIVLAQAKNSPDALAVIDQTVRIPYSELVTLATHTASQLQAKGVLPGDVVGVVHEKGWEQVVSTMAILMVGGVYLPLNPSHPDERLRSILSIAGVKLALVHAATVVGREWQIYENGQEVQCHHVLRDIDVDLSDQFVAESISPSDSAYIIFTSGSTGTPKGVEIAHEGAVNTCLDINHRFSLGTDTVTFGISSLGFDLSVWDIFGTLSAGGTLVMCKPDGTVDPDYWWQQVLEHGVTMWNTVPTSFEMLVQSRQEHVEMPIRSVLLSGDAIRVNMVEEAITAFPSLKVHALGGATEASIWSNYHTVTDSTFDLGTDLVPYGRPLSNQTMMVLDNKLRYRPSGAVGEIHIGGIGVAKGYFKSPELTQKSFIDTEEFGRIYKTGDLGRYLPNGEIEIIGRKDSQVKVGGHRVELAEIEKCAESVNNVSKASVIHIPGAGARLVGFVICNGDDDLVVNAVKTHIQQKLPDYMEPQTWIPVDTIPLTANNKVDAKALRTIANSNVTNEPKEAHTDSELVGQILELAANVLGVSAEHLSSSSNLAEQGLTSLYSVKLINLLSAKVGHRLPYTLIFNYPTANKLAAYLLSESDVAKRSESHSVSPADDPIAVIAVSCRLPGNVSSLDEFCYELEHKYHPVQDVPISRFDIAPFFDPEVGKPGKTYTKVGTFIENIHQFDNSLFQIPLGEAKTMDPQQRMLLEISYEAFLNGGYDLDALSGSDTGVFIGQMNYDWMMDFDHSRQYASTGSAPSISANRISYAFDLIGPSMTVDTACSSSLVSIDLAVSKLRAGECKLAIAGGINLILSPEPYLFTCQARMLSPDGRCATFDENANGIARGEGAGVVLLKRLSDAEKDGDPILGLITGTAVNQDGRSASLTAPNGLSQRKLLDASLSKAGLRGGELDYIECHGTGTALGDPIELEAISQAFSDSRDSALVLGAVKTNLGHLEGAAGIVGFIKSLGVINRRTAPANIHFSTLNPKIDLGNLKAVIPRDSVTLSPGEKGYISAGVSSFGYGGTNAHVTLKSYEGQSKLKTKHKSVWTFSGQGSVTSGAIESLYDHVPVFRESLEYYLGAVGELLGEGNSVIDDLLSVVLNASSSNTEILRDTAIQQPVIVAIQLAQIKMWTEWGVQPSAVLGHSVGELSASVAAGVMTDVDALKLSVARGRLLSECEPGYMVAVKTSLQDLPSPLPGKLEVAVVNSDTQVVLATTDLEDLDRLTSHGFTCHKLSVSHPFHSSFVKLASERFRKHINNIQLSLPDSGIKFISSVTGQVENERWQESRYWAEQITRPVDYASAMRTLSESLIGSEAIIELGANRVLTSLTEELKDKFPRIRSVVSKECVRGLPSLVAFHHKNLFWEPPKIGLTTIPTESARRHQSIKVPNWFERVTWAKKESVNQGSLNGVLIVGHENPWIDPNEQSEFVLFDEFRRVVGSPKPEKPSQFIYIADERSDILKTSVEFIQTLQQLDRACEVGVVIRGSQPHQESVAGLFKSACLEIPTACVSILVSEEKELDNALKTVLPLRGECARLDKDGLFWIRTTEPLSLEHEPAREREENGLHVISGGLGGLGKEAIKTLASLGAKYFLVLGTKPMSLISGKLNDLALELNNIEIHYEQCDVSLELDVRQVAQKYRAKYPITGVVHTAGILDDGFVASLTAEQFERPKNVKLIGAQNLYTQFGELDWFVAYSSISSEVGAMGQANYVAANSALDGWIEQLASKGHAVASVRWGVWSQCGMAYERDLVGSLSQLGYGVVNNQDGSSILSALVQYPLSGLFAASPIDRPSFTQRQEPVQLQTAKPESLSFESVQSITPVIWSEEKVSALVTSCLEDFCESEPNDELSFMDAGLSSLDLVQFREKLLAALPESVDIPAQFVFNYPTLKDVTDNLVEQLQDCIDVPPTQSDSDTMVSSITWQKLNDIEGEQAIFLLGGVVGNVEKTFAPLASSLPFPVFATMPEIPWDLDGGRLTLEGLAAQLTESLLQQYPRSRYIIGGLSFGATLSLEMGKLLEQRGLLERVLLLDPRHMDPFKAPVDPAGFETMLSQYSSDFVLSEPVHLMQCDVPAWESQSELMQEASRSFMPDSHIQECCRNRCANITVERVQGHHFNFLYKFKSQTASRISARVLSDATESLREDIAVIATSSILPGCNDSDSSFWALLEEGKHGIREIPKSRFDIDGRYHPDPNGIGTTYTRHGGFVETAELFDFEWFGISLTEAEVMDPQQRLLLEVTDQALHNAGYPKGSLKGSDTAVFVGLANDDWSAMGRDEYAHSPYFGAGVSSSIASNRISYLMGFKGPSMTIDTACSSSLVALKSAVDTLREGRSKIALVAGANVIAHDRMYISACATNALSRKGRCASFDAQADGYCRGEGAGAVVLKRLKDAQADGDSILAVIRGTAVNQDGKSISLTAPNGKAQEAVIQQALNEAELDGKDIHYVECHGTGTPLGDPIEVGALKATLGAGRQSPLVLSSLKSNIGHLEGAAGVAGLIKAIEVVRRRQAPGVAHFSTLNPNIDVTDFDVVISKDTTALPASGPVYAGISSFGFGGTNAHAIISSYEGSRPYEVRPVPYQRSFLPWRRLPNPLLSRTIGEGIGASLRGELGALWQDHRIQSRVLVPAASHLTMLSGLSLVKESQTMSCVGAERVVMHQPVEVTGEEGLEIRCLKEGEGARLEFGVNGEWHNAVSAGYIGRTERPVLADGFPGIESVRSRCEFSTYDERYHRLAERGVEFGSRYQNLEQLYFGNKEGLGYIRVDAGEPIERGQTLLSSPALDAGIQLLGLCGMESDQVYVPYSLKKISLKVLDAQPTTLCAYVTLTETGQDGIEGDVYLLGEDGECYAALSGLVCRPWRQQDPVSDSLYEVDWQTMAQPVGVEASGVVMSRKEPGTLPSGWRYTTVNSGADLSPVLTESASLPEQTTLAFLSQGDKEDSVLGLSMLQQLSALGYKGKVLFVLNPASKESAGLAGLVKSAQQECPALHLQCVDAAPHHIHRVLSEVSAFPDESHLRLTEQGTWESARLRRYHRDDTAPLKVREHATYVISGGHGALGQVAAEYLIDQGAKHLVLLSRRDIPESEWSEALLTLKGHARIESMVCDVSVEEEVSSLSDRLWQGDWPAVAGVIHTAGVLTDGTLSNQNAEKIAQACSVKVEGAEHLKRWLSPRDFMWLYSSAASVFGSMAQGSYALANSQLDHLARTWQGQGAAILSIQWGAWSNGGMAVRHGAVERAHAAGYGSISNALGLKVLDRLLSDRTEGSVCVCPLEWDRVSMTDSLVSDWVVRPQTVVSDAPVNEAEVVVADTWSKDGIREVVREAAKKAMGKAVSDTASLMANGLDSLNAVVLAQELSQSFDLSLGAVFALNHPTIEDMVTELEKEAPTMPLNTDPVSMGGEEAIVTSPQDIKYVEASAEPIAIISTASQLPGDLNTPDSLWRGVSSGLDAITEVPKSRFDIDAVYSEDPHGIGVSNTRKGGFISEAEYFDYTLFDIQKAEALVMDPHQRLMLEVGYQAFHSAGYDRRSLKGKRFGVFVGMANQDWMVSQGQDNAHNPYFGVGVSLSIASNRISHLLGLNGPSMTLDTACSSSLVALDLAVSKLREHDCDAALVGGVNVMMHHRTFVGSSAANMLSVQGRCASFDAQADGYCRGEGAGAVVLKRLKDAQADGDSILAVIRGTAVNQDGASATMTAPNGKAQEAVIQQALNEAELDGKDIHYVECHGTGTPLGDPIEVGALKATLGAGRQSPLVLSSLKSNIGHLEGAAGVAGLIKAIEVVRRRQAPGVAHFSTLNPNIDVTDFDVVISKDTTALPASGPVYAGISSFGFGGTNAHAIISSYEGSRPYEVRPVPYQRSFLPWRRLPNPLLSRTIGEGIGASLRGELGALWQDHRIQNRVLVPAASHLTMLSGLSLVKESQTMSCVGAERVVMHQPVEVTGEEGLEIRCLKEGEGARLEFGVNGEWHNAVSAGYIGRTERPVLADGFPGIESVRSRCEFSTYDERYHRLAERGVEFGSRYQNLEQLYFGNKEGLGYIRVDAGEPIERGQTLLSSPALDAGIQLLGLCGMESDQVYVPYSLKKISLKVLDAQPTTLCAYVTLTETGQDGIEGDVYLLGEDGECYAALSGLVCRPWRQQDPVSDSLYEVDWQTMAQPVGVEASGVVMSRKEPGTLPSGWRYTTVNSGADLSPVLTESASLPEQTTLAFLSQGDKEDSVLGLSMLQQLSALGYKGKVLFVLNPASKESAGLAGLVKSAQQECPALHLQCVDAAPHHIHRVLSEVSAFPDESHLRLTEQGTWESARLRRYHRDDTAPLKVREHATYVISGGHGALGQVAAEYLIDQGAKHLVLLSRRDIPESEWSEALLTLKGHARIESMVCDVSVEEEVSSLSDRLWQGDWPAVAGVIHTAGVLTDGTLSNQNAEKIAQACSVKVEGAEHLKRWLSPRDFMWLYSSAASVFGSMAQGSYALANSQLDHLARTWQGQGAAILSIQWGAWSNGGMAVRHGAVERAHAAGYGSISNALGLKVLDRLLSDRTEGSVCVCPLEWDRVSMTDSLVSDWVVRPQTVVSDAPVNEAEVVVTDTWSKDGIREVVREAAKKAMGKAVSDTASLMANGLDSLNAVVLAQELSQSFDLSLGAVFALNHPTIEDMVTELEKDAPKRNSVSLVKPVAQLDANNHVTEEHEQEEKEMVVASSTSRYDVAVVSTACRLPGGIDSADVLWEKLVNKTDCVTTIPSDRMTFSPYYDPNPDAVGKSYTNKGAFVDGVEFFDNAFFGIPLAEAKAMDPQQRMLLEVSCEAFYQAGYEMETLRGRSIGVFVGQMSNDWAHMHKDDQLTNPYFGAGSSSAITSNRLSYIYGLRGPSMTIDTACSSSLVAIDLAVEKLANGSCEAALVGGVNLMLSHRSFVGCCAAKMLSYEGRCASFDESADGYCRGEGIGAVVLKRLEDAQRDNDDILAVIKGSAVNQDGQSATLTAPNGKAQEDVISSALERAGLSGRDLDYVECHGTGTPLGDPIEMGALKHVTQEGREKPLVVGTIKSNMGHLEGAAGIAGFIKAVEVVRHRYSPGIVHLQNLNPKINLDGSQLKVSSQGAPLPREKVRAGVSSFGFGGTNAHVILESYGAPTESSAKTETENAVEYATMLFTGQGSLFSGCARSLYEKEPVFKQEFDRFTDYLDTLGVAVKDLLLVQSDRHNQMLTQTNIQQPALVSLQLAQLALWRARGVHPEKVLGHSVGEISAAVAAGILKTEDALKLAVMRSDFMFDCEFGGMAAVLVSAEKIESLPVDVVIAAENGPSLTVLAGPKGALQAYLSKHFSDNHINLPVSHAFHSPMMEPASKRLAAELTNIEFHPRKGNVRIFSTLEGREVNEEFASSRYWPEQMLASVKFLQATSALFDTYEPRSKVIELGGGNTLIGMTKRILPDLETTWVDSVNA